MRKTLFNRLFWLAIFTSISFSSGLVAGNETVNLYSARQEGLIKPLLDKFSEKTKIKVNLITGKDDALLMRLRSEGRNSPADVLLTSDAGRLYRAKQDALTQSLQSGAISNIVPPVYRDPENHWIGLSIRARTLMYSKDRVSPTSLSSYEALTDPVWRKRICVRSSNNIYNQSLLASIIASSGQQEAQHWAQGIFANLARKPKGGDRDQIKAVAAGVCDIAIVNTYYLGKMLESEDPAERNAAEKVGVYWPNQQDRGVHVNISGAAITRWAPNKDNAIKLLEFLLEPESQRWYAETNHEYPVRERTPWGPILNTWGSFKADGLNLAKLGEYNAEAVRIMDRVGWR